MRVKITGKNVARILWRHTQPGCGIYTSHFLVVCDNPPPGGFSGEKRGGRKAEGGFPWWDVNLVKKTDDEIVVKLDENVEYIRPEICGRSEYAISPEDVHCRLGWHVCEDVVRDDSGKVVSCKVYPVPHTLEQDPHACCGVYYPDGVIAEFNEAFAQQGIEAVAEAVLTKKERDRAVAKLPWRKLSSTEPSDITINPA